MDVLGGASSPWAVRKLTYVGLWTCHASRPVAYQTMGIK